MQILFRLSNMKLVVELEYTHSFFGVLSFDGTKELDLCALLICTHLLESVLPLVPRHVLPIDNDGLYIVRDEAVEGRVELVGGRSLKDCGDGLACPGRESGGFGSVGRHG